MPHWFYQQNDAWEPYSLDQAVYWLNDKLEPASAVDGEHGQRLLIHRVDRGRGVAWVLMGRGDDLLVNGVRLAGGVRVLQHKDHVLLGQAEACYSAESVVRVETYQDNEKIFCPRCKLEVTPGQRIVTCPGCELVYHEDEEAGLTCFTFAETCVNGHSTRLDGVLRWQPSQEML